MNYNIELKLLQKYIRFYVQIMPETEICGGYMRRSQIPTFEYFKENIDRFIVPMFKESKAIYNGKICNVYTHGIGSNEDGAIAHRFYNYYMGIKFFTGDNVSGNYYIDSDKINELLKSHK